MEYSLSRPGISLRRTASRRSSARMVIFLPWRLFSGPFAEVTITGENEVDRPFPPVDLQYPLDIAALVNVVGVEKKDDVARGVKKAFVEASQLPLVCLFDNAHGRARAVGGLQPGRRTVGRTVVDDHDLVQRHRLGQRAVDRLAHVSTVIEVIDQAGCLHLRLLAQVGVADHFTTATPFEATSCRADASTPARRGAEAALARIAHGHWYSTTPCSTLARSASEGNSFAVRRSRFELVLHRAG